MTVTARVFTADSVKKVCSTGRIEGIWQGKELPIAGFSPIVVILARNRPRSKQKVIFKQLCLDNDSVAEYRGI